MMNGKEVQHGEEGQRQRRKEQAEAVLIECRQAPAYEAELYARQWAKALLAGAETRTVEVFGPFVQIGTKRGHGVRHRVMTHAIRLSVAELTASSLFAIATSDGCTLGWCAFERPNMTNPLTIHFVCVDELVRRRGFGRMLLQRVLAFRDERAPRYTCITSGGAGLLRAVAALSDRMSAHAGDEATSGVVEARGI
jgi:GNAT superfamily N-acetyltransferase